MDVITAPAKLNLWLKVKGRAPNGYHLLEMINVSIDVCDYLSVSLDCNNKGFSLCVEGDEQGATGDDISIPEKNILFKIYDGFCRRFNKQFHAQITLKKLIPIGAGMGGGSSDAASFLIYLAEKLLGQKDDFHLNGDLMALALSAGADVPYFLCKKSALVKGIGETLLPMDIAKFFVSVIVPDVKIPTASVFKEFQTQIHQQMISYSVSNDLIDIEQKSIPDIIDNDLLPAVVSVSPVVGEILSALRIKGLHAGLTGSGSALFVVFSDHKKTRQAVEDVAATYNCKLFHTSTI